MDNNTILVVDDDRLNLQLLLNILSDAGYHVHPADSGELALAGIEAVRPDLILLDVCMDGFAVCRQLKAREETRDIPVIFICAAAGIEERVKGFELGAVDFITKPFEKDELLARVQTHLALRKAQIRLERQTVDLLLANDQLAARKEELQHALETRRESDERFRDVFEHSLEGKALTALDGTVLQVDAAFAVMLGRTIEDLQGVDFTAITHPDDIAASRECIRCLSAGERAAFRFEKRYHHADGHYVWCEVSVTLLHDAAGSPSYLYASMLDIAERKQAEAALRESEAVNRTLIENVPQKIFIKDKDSRYVSVNENLARGLGFSPGDLVGKSDYDFFPRMLAEKYRADDRRVMKTGLTEELDETYVQGGRKSWVRVIKAPVRDQSGKVIGVFGIFEDITERKRAADALAASEARYRRLFESAQEGILIVDEETGLILDVNPFLLELLRYPPEEMLGKQLWEVGLFADIVAAPSDVAKLQRPTYAQHHDLPMVTQDGRKIAVEFVSNVYEVDHSRVIQCNIREITEQNAAESRRALVVQVLSVLNRTSNIASLVEDLVSLLKHWTKIEAIGVRVREGEDFPYYLTDGFPDSFVGAKRYLSARNEAGELIGDSACSPLLECMCGNILRGRFNPQLPFFTDRGSFWTNSATTLIESSTDSDREACANYRCAAIGYESVALIPFRSDDHIIGLLQLSDHRPDRFTLETIKFLEGLGSSIGIALQRRQSEEARRDSETRYRALFEASTDGILIADTETKALTYMNPAICRMLGYTEAELKTLGVKDIHPEDALPDILAAFDIQARGEDPPPATDVPCIRKDGTFVYTDVSGSVIVMDGRPYAVGFFRYITERKHAEAQRLELESQIRMQQRLETIGQLAAGVAHDFNNLLTGITGFTRFAHDAAPAGSGLREDLREVLALADRAAGLTRQLLAFSRKQTLQPVVLNVNDLINDLAKMLKRLLGEHLDLEWRLAEDLGAVKVDPGQLEQVLVNLAVNSRDAMPDGGKLTVETANVELDSEYARSHAGTLPGPYVMLAVSDNGCGIEASVLARMFEPFFPTKGVGKGTGLGLSTVYGIVKQHGGNIWAYSEPGIGTTFKVYLPRVAEFNGAHAAMEPPALPPNTETILVVEDEDSVRQVAARILERQGYHVLTAALPSLAEEALAVHGESIALMITDIVMPERSGRKLYESAQARHPRLRVLYMSGYTDNAIVHQGVLDASMPFLQKPFTADALLHKVRSVLDGAYLPHPAQLR